MKKLAFTIAEVVITLGIIGLVAEMTIPTLVHDIQKQQYVLGFKKAYSLAQNGLKTIMAEEGVTELGNTSLFDGSIFSNNARQDTIDAIMKKHFKVVKSCKYGDNSCSKEDYSALGYDDVYEFFGPNMYNIYLADGMYFSFKFEQSCNPNIASYGKIKAYCGSLIFDTNGSKPPNKLGRDLMTFFVIAQNGSIYPQASMDHAMWQYGLNWSTASEYWRNNSAYCGSLNSLDVSGAEGTGCAARIIEEGWQMNY